MYENLKHLILAIASNDKLNLTIKTIALGSFYRQRLIIYLELTIINRGTSTCKVAFNPHIKKFTNLESN